MINNETGLPFEQMRKDALFVIDAKPYERQLQKNLRAKDLACHVLALLQHIDEIDGVIKVA